jgi:hypothetical protein
VVRDDALVGWIAGSSRGSRQVLCVDEIIEAMS